MQFSGTDCGIALLSVLGVALSRDACAGSAVAGDCSSGVSGFWGLRVVKPEESRASSGLVAAACCARHRGHIHLPCILLSVTCACSSHNASIARRGVLVLTQAAHSFTFVHAFAALIAWERMDVQPFLDRFWS